MQNLVAGLILEVFPDVLDLGKESVRLRAGGFGAERIELLEQFFLLLVEIERQAGSIRLVSIRPAGMSLAVRRCEPVLRTQRCR